MVKVKELTLVIQNSIEKDLAARGYHSSLSLSNCSHLTGSLR